ncbi:MAG: glutamate 5-kinase [Spirochaetes bacterium GWD1_27_9]|nr:MAG: glutamate 5-kinase [Spirochaetes bacterium GWB1_27_13]OHD24577.1 MAG: glutamate 5-kinase [Spirochaetes bacterium GWC1_27_15]OHD45572.1 MAG: glutamate 5-kinase [Spirochaetes bacterium GWD1_27_9]
MKKIVVKISSNLLNPDNEIDVMEKVTKEISELRKKNIEVIVVTSGAVMHGVKTLGLDSKPESLPMLQSCAAIGQISLMTRYQNTFAKYSLTPAQILVSTEDFKIRSRYLNLRNVVESLLDIGIIPVFNENDSVNTKELKFGDNDHLSSLITLMMNFELLIILTDVNGFYDKDPKINPDAKLINIIDKFDDEYLNFASNTVSKFTTGGMRKKIESAGRATKGGVDVFIGNGFEISLLKIVNGTEIGTFIKSQNKNVQARQKWLGFSPSERGIVFVDEGAFRALTQKNSSLLASGIVSIDGNFGKGSLISVFYKDLKVAQGLTNYSSRDLLLIKGKKSSEFSNYLKTCDYQEVIHKNNMFLL